MTKTGETVNWRSRKMYRRKKANEGEGVEKPMGRGTEKQARRGTAYKNASGNEPVVHGKDGTRKKRCDLGTNDWCLIPVKK